VKGKEKWIHLRWRPIDAEPRWTKDEDEFARIQLYRHPMLTTPAPPSSKSQRRLAPDKWPGKLKESPHGIDELRSVALEALWEARRDFNGTSGFGPFAVMRIESRITDEFRRLWTVSKWEVPGLFDQAQENAPFALKVGEFTERLRRQMSKTTESDYLPSWDREPRDALEGGRAYQVGFGDQIVAPADMSDPETSEEAPSSDIVPHDIQEDAAAFAPKARPTEGRFAAESSVQQERILDHAAQKRALGLIPNEMAQCAALFRLFHWTNDEIAKQLTETFGEKVTRQKVSDLLHEASEYTRIGRNLEQPEGSKQLLEGVAAAAAHGLEKAEPDVRRWVRRQRNDPNLEDLTRMREFLLLELPRSSLAQAFPGWVPLIERLKDPQDQLNGWYELLRLAWDLGLPIDPRPPTPPRKRRGRPRKSP
jgi:hypothetical protein